MKIELRPKDPQIKKILALAKEGGLAVKFFKTKTVIFVQLDASTQSKSCFKKILKATDHYNLMTWF